MPAKANTYDKLKKYIDYSIKGLESGIEEYSERVYAAFTEINDRIEKLKENSSEIIQEIVNTLNKAGDTAEFSLALSNLNEKMKQIEHQEEKEQIEEEPPEKTYHIGQKFKFINKDYSCYGDTFVLISVPAGAKKNKCRVLFANVDKGVYWPDENKSGYSNYSKLARTVNDIREITEDEFANICDGKPEYFELIEEPEVKS